MHNLDKKLIGSFIITCVILAFFHDNSAILLLLLTNWILLLYPFKKSDFYAALLGLLIFLPNNIMAVQVGTFYFTNPDFLGLPIWEFFMWSYYFIIVQRFSSRPEISLPIEKFKIFLTLLFALSFSFVSNKNLLLFITSAVIGIVLMTYRSRAALSVLLLMLVMGTLIEASGLFSEKWGYKQTHAFGLPLWYLTMWGGTGIFFYFVGMPLIARFDQNR